MCEPVFVVSLLTYAQEHYIIGNGSQIILKSASDART